MLDQSGIIDPASLSYESWSDEQHTPKSTLLFSYYHRPLGVWLSLFV